MKKLITILGLGFLLLFGSNARAQMATDPDSSTVAGWKFTTFDNVTDTCWLVRQNTSDTLWAHLDDTSAVLWIAISDTCWLVRQNTSDTLWAHLDDSTAILWSAVTDTCWLVRQGISDTLWAHLDDSSAVLWVAITDTAWMILDAIHDSLFANTPGFLTQVQSDEDIRAGSATDEYYLTYEATGDSFEWVALPGGGDANKSDIHDSLYANTPGYVTFTDVDDQIINKTTGWLNGGQITINGGDNTKIDISAGEALFVTGTDSPVGTIISWTAKTAYDPALVTRSKWVGVKDSSGSAQFVYDTEFDAIERRTTAILGRIWDSGGSGPTITNVGDYERPAWGLLTAFQDFVLEYGSWNISGNVYSANGTNLLLDKSAGVSYRYHAEDVIGQENVHTDAIQSPRNVYAYHLQNVSTTTSESDIEPDYYDLNGVKTALSNNIWSVQEVWFFPVSLTCHVLYGQVEYSSKANAIDGIVTETKVRNTDILDGAILRAYLVLKEGCTDLTDDATAEIRCVSMGGGGEGGGVGVWTKTGTNLSPTTAGDDVLLNTGETFSIADMTASSVPFFGASGLLSQDFPKLCWDYTNKRFGIGAFPNAPLEVVGAKPGGNVGGFQSGMMHVRGNGTAEFSNSVITGHNSFGVNTQLWYLGSTSGSNNDIAIINRQNAALSFWTNNTEIMRLTNDGKVGIGTDAPTSKVEVVSTLNVLADLAVEENYHFKVRNPNNTIGEGIGISFGMSSTGSQQTAAIVAKRTGANGQGDLRFYTKQSTTLGVAPALGMIIDSAGNVGIGTASPSEKLSVVGNITATSYGGITEANLLDKSATEAITGAWDFGGAVSLEIPAVDDPTTDAEGEIAWDTNNDAFEVFMGDEGESALVPAYQKLDALFMAPDGINDEVSIFRVDALLYPFGIEIDQISIRLPADAAYSMVFEEWAGDPAVAQNDISTVTTGASDTYAEEAPDTDAALDADDEIFLHIPATDVDWIRVQIIFHVNDGN